MSPAVPSERLSGPFRLVTPIARQNALRAVSEAPEGYWVFIEEETRNLDQNAAAHAALTEIAKQVQWHGKQFSVTIWKRLTMASWLREEGELPEMIPALDGNGFDIIYERTSKLNKKRFSSYLDWVHAFAAQNGVTFKAMA